MAEALAIVGLASSIITFVDAAQKVISRLKDYWESGRELPKAYANVRNQLAFMVQEVEEMKDEYHRGLIPADKAMRLHDAIEACNRQTKRLNGILDDVLPAPNDSKIQRGRKALRSLRREKEVAGIQASVESSKSTFTLYYVRHPVSFPIRPKVSWLERCCDIPATSVLHFVGREDVLQQIDEVFGIGSASRSDTTLNQPRRAVLLGMGGQGKTQTALRYCRKAFQNGTFNTVLWIDASSEISAHQAMNSILSKAEIPTSARESERDILAFKDALTSLKGPCLLVFDNYDTPRNFSRIADMFVQHEQICIMLTSRHHESLRLGTPIHVREMNQSDAEDLLLMSSGLVRQDVNPQNLEHTVNVLGCLPLALDQAGAYIRKLHLSLDVFEKHYIDRQKKILQYTPDLFEYRKSLSPGSEPSVLSVFTTWELSLEQLGDDRPHLEHLLTLSAFFDHNKVHEALFSTRCTLNFTACSGVQDDWLQCMLTNSAWDSYRFQDIIANMHGLSLLQKFWIEDGHIAFSLHPLVNDWLRTRVGDKDRAPMILEAAVTVVGTDGSQSLVSHLSKCRQDLKECPHILYNDCVDMIPPQKNANGAPVVKLVADVRNPDPHYWRTIALCCPHGRPCLMIPSVKRLTLIVSCYITGIMSTCTQRQPQKTIYNLGKLVDISIIFGGLAALVQRFGLFSQDIDPLFRKLRRLVEECKDQWPADDTLCPEFDSLIQFMVTYCQHIGTLCESSIDFKDADVKVKQVGERGVDSSFHTKLKSPSETESCLRAAVSTELAEWVDLCELFLQHNGSEKLALIRNALRSLPFLHSA